MVAMAKMSLLCKSVTGNRESPVASKDGRVALLMEASDVTLPYFLGPCSVDRLPFATF